MAERSLVYRFEGRFDNLKSGLAAGGKSVEDFNKKLMATDRQGAKTRAALGEIGSTAGKVGLAAAAGLAVVVGAAANFDQAMSNVQAATHESAANMDLLREAALKAGAETKFSATEAASAIEELSKAGVSTKDILGGGLDGAMSLAAAGNLEVGQAAEIAASALTQFRLAGEDVPHVADLLAAGAGKAQGEVTDLAGALNQSGLVAAQTGLSLEETVGTLSAFASAGLLGSDAGTSFKTMLQALTPTSEEASKLMSNLGISAYDAQGEFIGMSEFAGNLQASLKDLSVEQQNAAMKTIFGSDAVRAANVLFKQGAGGIEEWTDKVNDSGYAAKTAAERMNNLKGDWEQLMGALQTAMIGTGDSAQGPLRKLTQGATGVVDAFNKMPPATQNAVGGLLAITAVTGGGLWFGSKVISGVADTRQAISDLGIDSGKTGRAMRGLGRAAGAAGAGVALLAAMDVFTEMRMEKATLGLEGMTGALTELSSGNVGKLPKDLDGLADSVDRLANPNQAQAFQDAASDFLGGIGGGSQLKNARADIDAVDAALTNIVANHGADSGKDAFDSVAESAGISGKALKDLRDLLPNYKDALAGAKNEAKDAAAAETELTGATQTLATAQGQSVQLTTEQAEAFQKAREAASDTAGEFVNLGSSLNDSQVSLGDWIGQLEQQAKALRDFTANAKKAAKRGLSDGLVAELQAAGPEGAMRLAQLANASEKEIGRANRAWRKGQAAVESFVGVVAKVPPGVATKITVEGANSAEATAARVKQIMDGIKDKSVYIHVMTVQSQVSAKRKEMASHADGGTIGRADSGATVPSDGGAYYDRFPYLLAPLEEVISNRVGQASKYRPELKLINADAPPHMVAMSLAARMQAGRLADGGTAGQIAKGLPSQLSGGEFGMVGFREANRALGSLAQQVRRAEKAVKGSTAAVEREKSQRDALVSKRDAVASDVAGKYMSDLFSTQHSPFVAGAGGWKATLQSDIAKYREQNALQAQAAKQGLTGEAFRELAAKASNQQIGEMLKSGQIAEFQRLYNTRAAEASKAGSRAGQISYGAEVALANRELRDANKELRQQNKWLKALEKRAAQAEKDRKAAPGETGAAAAKGASGAGNRGRSNVRS